MRSRKCIAALRNFILLGFSLLTLSSALAQQNDVQLLAQSGDGEILAATYVDSTHLPYRSFVDFFEARTGSLLETAELSPYVPTQIDLSPTGDRLIWTNGNGDLGVYTRTTHINTVLQRGGVTELGRIEWSPSSNVIGWSQGSLLTFGDIDVQGKGGQIYSAEFRVAAFAFSPDGQRIATSHYSEDIFEPGHYWNSVQVWDDMFGHDDSITLPTLKFEDHGGGMVSWSPDGARLAVYEPGGFFVYDFETQETHTLVRDEATTAIAWSPDGSQLAIGTSLIQIWDTETWQVIREIQLASGTRVLYWSPDGQHLYNDNESRGLYLGSIALTDIPLSP